jgi:uncharacterized Zn-binding protein involved in type VI secretion
MKKGLILSFFLLFGIVILSGCSGKILTTTQKQLPSLNKNKTITITLYALKNYTDTPRAGKRAANIVEGVLSAKGYKINFVPTADKGDDVAEKSEYYMNGAVSEWRYKTGIDGEPAVALRLALYDTKTGKLVWSSVGSNNDWGNGSIGTTAQALIEDMFQ